MFGITDYMEKHCFLDLSYKKYLKTPEDFCVEEIIDPAFLRKYHRSGSHVKRLEDGDYALCVLLKRGQTTEALIREISSLLSLPEDRIGFAGLKDKHAITVQHITLKGVKKKQVEGISLKGASLSFLQYTNRHMGIGELLGNRFLLTLHGAEREQIEKNAENIKKRGVANFFGPQRFGKDLNNHDVGRLLLQGKLKEAQALGKDMDKTKAKFCIHAYQAFVFNCVLEDYLTNRGKAFFEEISVPGYESRMGNDFERNMMERMEQDNIALQNFRIDRLHLMCRGTQRAAFIRCDDLTLGGKKPLHLRFTLPKGSYASTLLQQVI